MNEAQGARAGVEPAHEPGEASLSDMEYLGCEGRTAQIVAFIATHMPEDGRIVQRPTSLSEVTPVRRLLSSADEQTVVNALVAAVKVCHERSDIEGVAGVLRSSSVPVHVKVAVVWKCEELGWAAPLRAWLPQPRDGGAAAARCRALERIDGEFGKMDAAAQVVSIKPPLQAARRASEFPGAPVQRAATGRY